jgi:leucyl aminopeptidase
VDFFKKLAIASVIFCSFSITASKNIYITIGADAITANKKTSSDFNVISIKDNIAIVEVDESKVEEISHLMHEEFHRCGGFIKHDSYEDAAAETASMGTRAIAKKFKFIDHSLTQKNLVTKALAEVREDTIADDIKHLSSYKNRHYKSKTGVASQKWLHEKWKKIANGRSDIDVSLYEHKSWDQPSVIMKIEGKSSEAIIIGGHGDSIAGWGSRATAPGADDNASGIATVTEVLRVLIESSYTPEKTIYFMSYAAEEVGLLGSKEIAKDFKSRGIDVVGVLQLDMTNFKGSEDLDIVMMTDFTNDDQNKFLGNILDSYLPEIKWGYDKCGYGCSDHASWHGEGFPASVPFESKKGDMNRNIHTRRDTIERSGGHARHAAKFAKLALAFVIELDR